VITSSISIYPTFTCNYRLYIEACNWRHVFSVSLNTINDNPVKLFRWFSDRITNTIMIKPDKKPLKRTKKKLISQKYLLILLRGHSKMTSRP
jgi:hypothetical protein